MADRFGLWGPPGSYRVAWGNWHHFIRYVSVLTSGVRGPLLELLGIASTLLEIILGVFLLAGFKIKTVSLLSGILLLLFALGMSFNTGIKSAWDASVYAAAFGALLLSLHPKSKWSLDNLKRR